MSRRAALAFILVLAAPAPSPAQVRFPGRPNAWTSVSIGLYQLQDMFDPESNSTWDFGNIVQFRGTLERDFQRGMSLGVIGTLARAPLTYFGDECAASCDADVTLWQALALFRIGGGVGLHQVIEVAAGVTGFSSFSRRGGGGGAIGPGTVIDPAVHIGYGFGYSLSPTTQFTLLQEVGLMVHQRGDRPAGDESNVPRTYATRIGLRFGLGGWR